MSLLAVLGSMFGLAYILYAPARVTDAIERASREVGLRATYSLALPRRPGATLIRDLTLTPAQPTWTLRIGTVEVSLTPVFGGPRQISLELREQPMRLQRSELEWTSTLSARVQLAGLATTSLDVIRAVEVRGKDGLLRIGDYAARDVSMSLGLTETATGVLSGRIAVRGIAHPQLLQQLGARPEVRNLLSTDLDAPFELKATVTWTATEIRLEDVAANWSDASFEGRLAWFEHRAEGALLVRTPTEHVGLSVVGDEAWIDAPMGAHENPNAPRPAPHISPALGLDGSS